MPSSGSLSVPWCWARPIQRACEAAPRRGELLPACTHGHGRAHLRLPPQLPMTAILMRIDRLAGAMGSERCGVMGLYAENGEDWVVADLAAASAGVTLVPLPAF